MVRWLLIGVLVTVASGATLAQSYRWVPGLDFTADVYQDADPKTGVAGPRNNKFGYDNAGGMATVLYVNDACFVTWRTWAETGQGAIIGVIQYGPKLFALLHETGFLKLDQQPESAWCTPVNR